MNIGRTLLQSFFQADMPVARYVSRYISRHIFSLEPNVPSYHQCSRRSYITQDEQVAEQLSRNVENQPLTELVRDFLAPAEFFEAVRKIGISFFCGVPDSLLKDFCAYVATYVAPSNHVIATNEGCAVAIATGYHMATGKIALVYMQNSGLGNAVNPLTSLVNPAVYSIPMLLLIGWRGEPGKRDEPQHKAQGTATPGLLASLDIPFQTLPDYEEGAEQALHTAKEHMEKSKGPYALLVRRQTFLPWKQPKVVGNSYPMPREEALKIIVDSMHQRDIVVATTGYLSRELFEHRASKRDGHEKDFLTLGSMGHAGGIATGIALAKPNRRVYCLDGDGSALMHMGSMATVGERSLKNLVHVVINNGVHDSVGAQPTAAAKEKTFSFIQVAKGCGYEHVYSVSDATELRKALEVMDQREGPLFLEVKTIHGSRKNVGRPTRSPLENKSDFMHFLAIN